MAARVQNFDVKLPRVHVVSGAGGRRHAEYVVRVSFDGLVWSVRRRFREFDQLASRLKTLGVTAKLPPKTNLFRNKLAEAFLDERRRGLQDFLHECCGNGSQTERKLLPPWKLPSLDRFLEFSSHALAVTMQQVEGTPDGGAALAMLKEEGVVGMEAGDDDVVRLATPRGAAADSDVVAAAMGAVPTSLRPHRRRAGEDLFDQWALEDAAASSGERGRGGAGQGRAASAADADAASAAALGADGWQSVRALELAEAMMRRAAAQHAARVDNARSYRSALQSKEDAFGSMLSAMQEEVLNARARMRRALERRDQARAAAARAAEHQDASAAAKLGDCLAMEARVRALAAQSKRLVAAYSGRRPAPASAAAGGDDGGPDASEEGAPGRSESGRRELLPPDAAVLRAVAAAMRHDLATDLEPAPGKRSGASGFEPHALHGVDLDVAMLLDSLGRGVLA
ncbi:hypothetical protein FNF27_00898 [Cafeteria roenbergensis]|uniref:PX domain-containing protein n=2 Tax=Cafeteria roenbergensis TaxID=33653 RepID=A0A5A8CTF3_CAFRO|nr:hypothetical protein FNF29_01146 [Cafeteria roenbergensis]KAA0177726.1 hypothetical protein FNF27_00898 [Cafeteria roenbergensis]|eukprot:KAA0156353.1 hypothetical protein FNF29_01146 [Cafeteria roenbergensis]